jgi:hypothetical protein
MYHQFASSFDLGKAQPALLIGAPALLAALALASCYFPARRSTEVDPLKSLRQE